MVVVSALGVAVAYLIIRLLMARAAERWLVVPGFEYLVLGLLLGPVVLGLGAFEDPTPMLPLAALAAGWVGMWRGTEFDLSALSETPRGGVRLGILTALTSGIPVIFAAYWFFASGWLGVVSTREAWMNAGWLGCAAASASVWPIDSVGRRYELGDRVPSILRRGARFADMTSIVGFGLLFCVLHEGGWVANRAMSPVEWAVIGVVAGVMLGLVFTPFLGRVESRAGRALSMAGIVAFASGAAYSLELSPIWVCLMIGAVMVNTAFANDRVRQTLQETAPLVKIVLLVFAGALFLPPAPVPAMIMAVGYVLLRFGGKMLGSFLAARTIPMRADLGRGLLGQGEVTIAMAISFRLVFEGPAVDVAYTAVLFSVVLHDLLASRWVRGLLVDAGEIRREIRAKG